MNRTFTTSTLFALVAAIMIGCSSTPSPKSATEAHNTRSPEDIVREHLRAVEAGDWTKAASYLADNYAMKMKGMPFFISIKKDNAFDMHKARKQAFPDFTFNEKIEGKEGENGVKIAVYLKGTHTGYLDYPIAEVPKLQATGKKIDLPSEFFTYYVENDKILYTYGEIPEGHGPAALKQQLGVK
jgi:hypothetical protein